MRVYWSGRILQLTSSPVGSSSTLLIRKVTSGLEVMINLKKKKKKFSVWLFGKFEVLK